MPFLATSDNDNSRKTGTLKKKKVFFEHLLYMNQ